jgi:tetratricopeptide (TPR) repeat protein
LWDIEQISSDISDNQEKIQKIVNKYEHLLDTEEDQNSKFLYDSINSYLNFCHLNFMDGKKSNEVFISYNEKLKIDGKITEAWVLTFIRFMLSTTHGSNSVRPGKIYILNNPETADKNFEDANNFLNKILDTNSVTKASMWFLDAKKIHHLSKKDFNSYKELQEEYLERLKSAFTEESDEYNKACVKIADDLERQSENESKCPDFYDDRIKLGMKSLKHLLDEALVSHSHLAHQYQKIASLYIKKKTYKKALDFTKKALDQYHKKFETQYAFDLPSWGFIDGELIPLSKNIKELFYTKSGKVRNVVVDYGLCILNHARCLSIQKRYEEAIEMIDKACIYYHVFPKLNHLSQLEKGMNLFYNKSKIGLELITNSLKNLDHEILTKSENRIIKKAKRLIKK